jgi:hypothetical protein
MNGISYLGGKTWNEITREERMFCARLYQCGQSNSRKFARWVVNTAHLAIDTDDNWELGYEVCFYRDLLYSRGHSVRRAGLPAKRTFDLCLFSQRSIIVIEAKAFQCFETDQAFHVARDRSLIRSIVGDVNVQLVALGPSSRLHHAMWLTRGKALEPFHGFLTWQQAHAQYCDPIFERADRICRERLASPAAVAS